jgi:hypothetical protein
MSLALHGLLSCLALVLAFAALAKVRRPESLRRALDALGLPAQGWVVRGVAAIELGLAALALLGPTRLTGALLAVLFASFALFSLRLARAEGAVGCGCFGEQDADAPGALHIAACVLVAGGAMMVAVLAHESLLELARDHPVLAVAALAEGCVAFVLWRWLSTLGAGEGSSETSTSKDLASGLVGASAAVLERRFTRRSVLLRLALAGSAFAVAPLRYLLEPVSALAVIVPGSCSSGECTDGYTAFCCQINNGANECPAGTFAGGWWMCTDYSGRRLCAAEGVRYYVDCNAIPGQPFPGGCRCANGTCEDQRINCNIFRYGQCNTHLAGVTAVVCRMVVCQNPSTIPALKCSSSLSVDDAVCAQDAYCLEPAAVQLVGAGGV